MVVTLYIKGLFMFIRFLGLNAIFIPVTRVIPATYRALA